MLIRSPEVSLYGAELERVRTNAVAVPFARLTAPAIGVWLPPIGPDVIVDTPLQVGAALPEVASVHNAAP